MKKIGWLFCIACVFSCNENDFQEEIPYAFFEDIRIELDLPQYNDLSFDGGYMTLNEGVRGIILYRENESSYHAYEMICSYHPQDACATINVHGSGLTMFCPCCNSTFSFTTGYPTGGGPAQYPLRKYQVYLDRRVLTVTDEPVI
ncbi:MAG: hypothetical protein WD555_00305 [Fulvivirga sp.]